MHTKHPFVNTRPRSVIRYRQVSVPVNCCYGRELEAISMTIVNSMTIDMDFDIEALI